jgi:hypothetical protein
MIYRNNNNNNNNNKINNNNNNNNNNLLNYRDCNIIVMSNKNYNFYKLILKSNLLNLIMYKIKNFKII